MADLYQDKANSLFSTVGSSKSEKLKVESTGKEILRKASSGEDEDEDNGDDDGDDDDDMDEDSTLGADNDNDNSADEDEDGDDDIDMIGNDDNYIYSNRKTISGDLKLSSANAQEDSNEHALPSTSAGSGNLTLVSSSLDSVALSEEYISPPVPWNMAVVDRILSGKDIKSSSTLSSGHSPIHCYLLTTSLHSYRKQQCWFFLISAVSAACLL